MLQTGSFSGVVHSIQRKCKKRTYQWETTASGKKEAPLS